MNTKRAENENDEKIEPVPTTTNPAMLVKTPQLPTKVEFSQDQSKETTLPENTDRDK